MKKHRQYYCELCGIQFDDARFDISAGSTAEIIIFCPNGCIQGTIYAPDICCNLKEIKLDRKNRQKTNRKGDRDDIKNS